LNTDESKTVPIPPPQIYTTKNNNIHTISTKCQYQAANKNPKWCIFVKWYINILQNK
jgi:hypothetical protein